MKRTLFGIFALAFGTCAVLRAQSQYSFQSFNIGGPITFAYSINNSGQVVGVGLDNSFNNSNYIYQDGVLSALPFVSDTDVAASINESGQIAGTVGGTASVYSGGAWASLGTMGYGTTAYAINNSGVAVGDVFLTPLDTPFEGQEYRATYYSGGSAFDIGTLGGTNSSSKAVNDSGKIAGISQITGDGVSHAFSYSISGGMMVDLGTLDGTGGSEANGINNSGSVVGRSDKDGSIHSHAVLWDENGITDLDPAEAFQSSFANDINNTGQVVGNYIVDTGVEYIQGAFLYENGTMVDLQSLVIDMPEDEGNPLFTLRVAYSINDLGDIVGIATDREGYIVGFKLSAVPEPSTWLMLAGGMGALFVLSMINVKKRAKDFEREEEKIRQAKSRGNAGKI